MSYGEDYDQGWDEGRKTGYVAGFREGFAAGAAAMREAAAAKCHYMGDAAFGVHEQFEDGCDACVKAIRALPLPTPESKA